MARIRKLNPDNLRDRALLSNIHYERHAKEAVAELHGVAGGIIYDGKITDDELQFLRDWLHRNAEYQQYYPIADVKNLIEDIDADDRVDNDERLQLIELLSSFTTSATSSPVVAKVFTPNPVIAFPKKKFLFTGSLAWGTRYDACHAVSQRGGIARSEGKFTLDTDYLIVGEQGSDFWKFKRYGSKLEAAIEANRAKKAHAAIVRETTFVAAVVETPQSHEVRLK